MATLTNPFELEAKMLVFRGSWLKGQIFLHTFGHVAFGQIVGRWSYNFLKTL